MQQIGFAILDGNPSTLEQLDKKEIRKVLSLLSGCQELGHTEVLWRYRQLSLASAGIDDYHSVYNKHKDEDPNSSSKDLAVGAYQKIFAGSQSTFTHPLAECRPYDSHDLVHLRERVKPFFPGRGENTDPATSTCIGCAAIFDCLDFTINQSIKHGIWGGSSERSRRSLRKEVKGLSAEQKRLVYVKHLEKTAEKLNLKAEFQAVLDSLDIYDAKELVTDDQFS